MISFPPPVDQYLLKSSWIAPDKHDCFVLSRKCRHPTPGYSSLRNVRLSYFANIFFLPANTMTEMQKFLPFKSVTEKNKISFITLRNAIPSMFTKALLLREFGGFLAHLKIEIALLKKQTFLLVTCSATLLVYCGIKELLDILNFFLCRQTNVTENSKFPWFLCQSFWSCFS